MPKITAATVAEHHTRQREAVFQAALEILASRGAAAVTPAAVGARAGLARSSVYLYFPSTAALLAALVEDAFTQWNTAIADALAPLSAPGDRIEAYVRATLHLAAEGRHRAAAALLHADLPAPCRARLRELHDQVNAPFAEAIGEAGVRDPALVTRLLGGALQAGMGAVEDGAALESAIDATVALARAALPTP